MIKTKLPKISASRGLATLLKVVNNKKIKLFKIFLKKFILTCFLVIYCIKVGTNEELECQSNIWSQKKCHYSSVLDKLIEKELYVVSKNVSKSVSESSSKKILVRSFHLVIYLFGLLFVFSFFLFISLLALVLLLVLKNVFNMSKTRLYPRAREACWL